MDHQSDPTYYPCCHPLPVGGKVDSRCRSVGDDCEEGEQNCFCEFVEEGDDDDGEYDGEGGAQMGSEGGGSGVTQVSTRGWSTFARAFLQMT